MKRLLAGLWPLAAGAALGLAILGLSGDHPGAAMLAFVAGPFSNAFAFGNMLDQAGLLLLGALGFSIGMRLGVFNLGGEGQAYAGAVAAAAFALAFPGLAGPVGIFGAALAAMAVCAATGAAAALLWRRLGISELISTFLLSGALVPLLDYGLSGPWRDPASNLLATQTIAPGYFLPQLLPPSSLHAGAAAALLCALALHLLYKRSRWGYETLLAARSREFARAQGVRVPRLVLISLLAGSAVTGLAGALAALGGQHGAAVGISAGVGWNGIAAALIGRNHPLGAVAGALAIAWLGAGAQAAMLHSNLSLELSTIVQGCVILLATVQAAPWRSGAADGRGGR